MACCCQAFGTVWWRCGACRQPPAWRPHRGGACRQVADACTAEALAPRRQSSCRCDASIAQALACEGVVLALQSEDVHAEQRLASGEAQGLMLLPMVASMGPELLMVGPGTASG